ncbi:hypothetical protein MNR01_06485 [Lysobacter sp. S4-A87]|uniref:hypothetical protein n=1 Tax=Lysobacter sp. S4-A87 TaxID=2925843 RepID=UPI001F533F0A|nr:hypothetical protein [Lysobacter sp. S4-A87]UNK50648.1 hypothetical protein MNR01_06485 [Lysobacter sp. S4-A87]
MGIDVYWKDERGEVLGTVEDNGVLSDLSHQFYRQSGSTCLRFIDPAGDACFNQLQRPLLVTEMRELLPAVSNARAHTHLQAIVDLLEGAVRSHTYIWFVGD